MSAGRPVTVWSVVCRGTAGCASQFKDIKVEPVSSPTAAFGGYESYAWVAAAAIVHDPAGEWTRPDLNLGAEIVHLVNPEFRSRGRPERSAAGQRGTPRAGSTGHQSQAKAPGFPHRFPRLTW